MDSVRVTTKKNPYRIDDLKKILGDDKSPIRVDLGCGARKREGCIGIDQSPLVGADIVWDLEKGIPLEDNCVDEVYSSHFFEHIGNLIFLFQEVYRVCKNGAGVQIVVPYYASLGAFKDPTHARFFTEDTLSYFSSDKWYGSDYGIDTDFEVVDITYHYIRPFKRWFPFISLFRRFLLNVVHSMTIRLRVIK